MRRVSRKIFSMFIILTVIFTSWSLSSLSAYNQDPRNLELFAHFDERLTVLNGMVLGISPTWGETMSSNATIKNFFTLYPPLGNNLTIKGIVTFKSWLKADRLTYGKLIMSLYEVDESGEKSTVTSVEGFVSVLTRELEYNFGVAGLTHTFKTGSAIQIGFLFQPSKPTTTNVHLLWNSPSTATRVILPCLNHIKGSIFLRSNEELIRNRIVSLNDSKDYADLSFRINISNPFGIDDIKNATLTLKNSYDISIMREEPMTPISFSPTLYDATFAKNLTLSKGRFTAEVTILDSSGGLHRYSDQLYVTPFYILTLIIKDGGENSIANATYTIINGEIGLTEKGVTNSEGLLRYPLPASSIVGEYYLAIDYRGIKISKNIEVDSTLSNVIIIPIYTLRIRIDTYGIPLYGAEVILFNNSRPISSGETDLTGLVEFENVPLGNYSLNVIYLFQLSVNELNFNTYKDYEFSFLPPLFRIAPLLFLISLTAIISLNIAGKKIFKPKTVGFQYLNRLISGKIPEALSMMIQGPPGSGKTAMLENFVKMLLDNDRNCIYITNTGFPDEIRQSLRNFKVPVDQVEEEGKLVFIDCYSGIAEKESKEKHFVSSPGDLTKIGIEVSNCLESSNSRTDICFDSLSQLSTYVKIEQLTSFIHTIGARIKGEGGRFLYTVGSNIDQSLLGMIEEASDFVVELKLGEQNGVQERSLRIKKFRGAKHSDRWIKFEVRPNIGIVFTVKRRIFY